MSSWGKNDAGEGSSETKPRHLTTVEQRDVYATNQGWTAASGGNDGKDHNVNSGAVQTIDREVLVAIGDLAGTATITGLAGATISSVRFTPGTTATTDFTASAGATITAQVVWNEAVVVTGTPAITVANGNQSTDGNGDYILLYTGGTGTNRLNFTLAAQTISATDILSLGVNPVVLNGGTVKDKASGTVVSELVVVAGIRKTRTVAA
jgi:hypothetical protein